MNTLKVIFMTMVQVIRDLPRNIANAFQQRRQKRPPSAKELEAERIDRIRFPSKYRGK